MDSHRFIDKNGAEWTIEVTLRLIAEAEKQAGIDLRPDAEIGQRLTRLAYDVEGLVNVIYLACKTQADERGIDDAAFGDLFDGNAFDAATQALMGAYVSFCPALMRQGLLKTLAAQKTAETMAMNHLDTELADDKIRKMVDDAISGAMSSGSPASSGATPTP